MFNEKEKFALRAVERCLEKIRAQVPAREFDPRKVAEVEENKFYFNGDAVDRLMVVLRATGCSHYKTKQGCAMCAHFDGTVEKPVTVAGYLSQWRSVVTGKAIDEEHRGEFDLNNYTILCLYNLGSFLNPEEIPLSAAKRIFQSLNRFDNIKKVIIESRAEFVTPAALSNIRDVYPGLIEVGMGLESVNDQVRELCHHKNMPDLQVFIDAIDMLHKGGFKALAYVNQKPPFLTEKEAIDDAVETSLFALANGVDAVSIEPTSLQTHSLTDLLYQRGLYRVPWLWSVREVVMGIYNRLGINQGIDLRLGGYFDEKILSGSQGVAPGATRNELFPYTTAGNCRLCDGRMVEAIKEFNKTYDLKVLDSQPPCPECYPVWENEVAFSDPRDIPERIIAVLGLIDETI